jgi:hypothetical protein
LQEARDVQHVFSSLVCDVTLSLNSLAMPLKGNV